MIVVRVLTALVLLAAAGCDSEDKARLKQKRYLLDVELTQKRNIARDLKAAQSDRARLQRVFTGLETDYSDGNLIAAMDASTKVKLTRMGPPTERTPFVRVQRLELSSPASLAKELERLRDSTFPAFELDRIRWDESGMTVELLVPQPNLNVELTGSEPATLSTPQGHWWDGSQQLRADCEDLARQLADVDAALLDAGATSLRHELAVYKRRAEEVQKADAYLRAQPRYIPPESALMMNELAEGTWSRESGKGLGKAKGADEALRALGAVQPSAQREGDQLRWSADLP